MALRTHKQHRWKIDYDYETKLDAASRSFLDKFTNEYYRSSISEEPLHNPEQIRGIWYENNVSYRDIYSKSINEISKARTEKMNAHPSVKKSRYYDEEDYSQTINFSEDALIDFLDSQKHTKTIKKVI